MAETRTDAAPQQKVWDMIRDVEIAMMVTMDEQGRFHSRPMRAVKQEFEGVLWFFTKADSPKVQEAKEDERTLLAYCDPRNQNYVSVSGHAQIVRDAAKQKEFWSEPLRTWFPGGPEGPDVALMKVEVDGAEYWDSPSSTFVHAYGYIKSVTTGKSPSPGENSKVDFTKSAS